MHDPPRNEISVHVRTTEANAYAFASLVDERFFENVVSRRLPASIREDLRLLRWKATGLHDPGDALLANVGHRISSLVFPQARNSEWQDLFRASPTRLRVQFEKDTEDLLHLPWELFRVNDRFVLQDRGSHIVRELQIPTSALAEWKPSVLHVSFGIDSALRLDEERSMLLNEFPGEFSLTFLLNPTVKELDSVLALLRPSVVVVSGHGRYDDIAEVHAIDSLDSPIGTDTLTRMVGRSGCSLLLLWTCESARLASGVTLGGVPSEMPTDVISFSYPVQTSTAIAAARAFFKALVTGSPVDDALAGVRTADSKDLYSFFNVVHYHSTGRESLRIPAIRNREQGGKVTGCAGREQELLAIDVASRKARVTTVLAPVGCRADSLISHWHALNMRSAFTRSVLINPESWDPASSALPRDVGWLVFDDRKGAVDVDKLPGRVIRAVAPKDYKSRTGEQVIPIGGIDLGGAVGTIEGGSVELAHEDHPLFCVPGFLEDIERGATPDEATAVFEQENDMTVRHSRLGEAGRYFASLLYTLRGSTRLPGGDRALYAEEMKACGNDPQMLLSGIGECLDAQVVFQLGADLLLSPEFLLLGEKWFPSWRTDHVGVFRTVLTAFVSLDHHGKFDLNTGEMLLGWAMAIGAWGEAGLLCVRMCSWYAQQGRLDEMKHTIEKVVEHIDGEEKLVLEGHLITILTDSGRYAEALNQHRAIEARVRSLPRAGDTYFPSLIACLTQQIGCLLELNRLDEALTIWHGASEVASEWAEPNTDVRPRLLAQRAQIHSQSGDLDSALRDISEAISLAQACPGVLAAELRTTRSDFLRQLNRIPEAAAELRKIEPFADSGSLRSRLLHQKGLIMEQLRDPRWIEHVLESYEHDRERGDMAGVAISLVTMARIFIDQGEIERAKDRLREAFPYIRECGLADLMGTFACLWAEVELDDGSRPAARSWLLTARKFYQDSRNNSGLASVSRLLASL